MDKLRKITGIVDIFVFAATTLAIAGVFYEGMTLKWYDFVGILVICMDYSFMPATILHLFADRKEKKQDYTPQSLARLMGALTGNADRIVDMCAGSGALIIQKWNQNHDIKFTALEIDENVIPFLLFNMTLRNIRCRVFQMNALTGDDAVRAWDILKGETFGNITDFKPTV